MVYRRKSRMGFVSSVNGNARFLCPCKHVVQAEASMQSVIPDERRPYAASDEKPWR